MIKLFELFKKKYPARFRCGNCEKTLEVYIPKGTTIAEYKKNGICPNCGCKYNDLVRTFLGGDDEKEQDKL